LGCGSIGADDDQKALGIEPLAVKGAALRELSDPGADEILFAADPRRKALANTMTAAIGTQATNRSFL
jgi:hypothetical protein